MQVRQPAVAGTFYPDNPQQLRSDLETLLDNATEVEPNPRSIKALIVPHAGYIYSGPIAATAYKALLPRKHQIRRVVLLGPSHRVALRGLAIPENDVFRTPLGDIPLDMEALQSISSLPDVITMDRAHSFEHSLEVQLPFLQAVLGDFLLVPLVVGNVSPESVATVLGNLWGDEDTLVVISSDLSHYLPYNQAIESDSHTSALIEDLDGTIAGDQACGCHPLNGLLKLAQQKGLDISTLDLRNSGDTAGSRNQVVGYGSYAVYQ